MGRISLNTLQRTYTGLLDDVMIRYSDDYSNEMFFNKMIAIGVWKKLKQKMDERHIKRCPNIGHEKSKH
jgi:hypothetical protein